MRSSTFKKLLVCCLLLRGVVFADQPTFPSPDGLYILVTEKNEGSQGCRVNLIDAKTHKVIDSYNPETRAIEAFWNPTGKMVAINEDISHQSGNLSLWRIVNGHFKAMALPVKLISENLSDNRQQEAIYHFISANDAKRIKTWWGAHDPSAVGWLNETDLNVTIGGDAQLEGNDRLSLEYDFVLHVVPPKASILSETKKQYEISGAKSN